MCTMVSIASAAFSLCRPSEFSTSVLTLIHLGQNTTKERRSHKKVSLSVPISTFADVLSRVDKNTFANFSSAAF